MQPTDLSPRDLGFFGESLTSAAQQWRSAAKQFAAEHSLGPRGPWILGLVARRRLTFPSDLSAILQCSKGAITGELAKLEKAGLIDRRTGQRDGRKVELSVTRIGNRALARLADLLIDLVATRLANHSRADLLHCSQLLRDFGLRQ